MSNYAGKELSIKSRKLKSEVNRASIAADIVKSWGCVKTRPAILLYNEGEWLESS